MIDNIQSKECQRKHWKQHKSECKFWGNLTESLSPELDRRQRALKAWFNQQGLVLTEILQDALLPHQNTQPTITPLYTTHMMVVRVAEVPKGSRSGKFAIQNAWLSSLSNLRHAFRNPADYEPSMQDDRNYAAEWEAKLGGKFDLVYLLIRCDDPDENQFLNEIVRVPLPEFMVEQSKHKYLTETWETRLKQHFQISDDTPFVSEDNVLRIQRDGPSATFVPFVAITHVTSKLVDFINSKCDWVLRILILVLLYISFR